MGGENEAVEGVVLTGLEGVGLETDSLAGAHVRTVGSRKKGFDDETM